MWNRIPSFQGDQDDKILINFVSILLEVCDPEKASDKKHFYKSLSVLEKLIEWRNAIYVRVGSPFPSKEMLAEKHKLVSQAANALYETWAKAWTKVTPYVHAILHNEAYLTCDVVDRSAEALEHLNKIIKSITKRGLKRYTSVQKAQDQKAKAQAAGKSNRGHHDGGTSTTSHAMKISLARAAFNRKFPQRKDWRVRKQMKEGRMSKQLTAIDLEVHLK